MPRLQPAPGYITAKEALAILDVSDATLSLYVKKGWLKRYGPSGRKHLFYKHSEVLALAESRLTFDEYQEVLPVSFEVATTQDIPAIAAIDEATFNKEEKGAPEPKPKEVYLRWIGENYLRWLRKNPEALFVLRDSRQTIVGYACLLPLHREVMERFVRGEIGMDGIADESVDLFEPGKPLSVYVIALCVDPSYKASLKHSYGASLVRGLMAFVLELGRRGVEIESITARTHKADGIRLMRKMGIPQLRSSVAGKHLFAVCVAESGFPLFVQYSELLTKAIHHHHQ